MSDLRSKVNDVIYRFGGFQFDPETGTVTNARRQPVELRPKAVRLMTCLIENRDRILSKEEIFAAVWPDRIVEDQAIFQAVFELRSAFSPLETIRTYRGRGYRWTADTRRVARGVEGRFKALPALATATHVLFALAITGVVFLSSEADQAPSVALDTLTAAAAEHVAEGRLKAAEALLRAVLEAEPGHLEGNIELGNLLLISEKNKAAKKLAARAYKQSTAGSRHRAESALLLSQVLADEGKYDGAKRFADEAIISATRHDDLVVIAAAQEQHARISETEELWEAADAQYQVAQRIYEALCPSNAKRVAQLRDALAARRSNRL